MEQNNQQIFTTVQQFIFDKTVFDSVDEITADSHLKADIGLDSLDTIELARDLEIKFNCSIKDEQLEKWQTVQDVVNCIAEITTK